MSRESAGEPARNRISGSGVKTSTTTSTTTSTSNCNSSSSNSFISIIPLAPIIHFHYLPNQSPTPALVRDIPQCPLPTPDARDAHPAHPAHALILLLLPTHSSVATYPLLRAAAAAARPSPQLLTQPKERQRLRAADQRDKRGR